MSVSDVSVKKLVVSGEDCDWRWECGSSLNSELGVEKWRSVEWMEVGRESFGSIGSLVVRGLSEIISVELNCGSL